MSALYETDTYTWAMKQSDALRRRSANEIDWDNVAEEIESVGKTELRELRSRYTVLLTHLLKWLIQPHSRSASWEITIKGQRRELTRHLAANPGLKLLRDSTFGEAYMEARDAAAIETALPLGDFPDTNPFTLAQAMDDSFWPDGPNPG
jgi:hypothetical protein